LRRPFSNGPIFVKFPVLWRNCHKKFQQVIPSFRGMTEKHVVSALRLKRAEISGHIHDLETRIARQRASLANLDATIKLFSPAQTPTPSRPSGHIGGRGISLIMNCRGLRKTLCGPHQYRSRQPK
jgi:hypothetical protein